MQKVAIIGANSFIARNFTEYILRNYKNKFSVALYDIQPEGKMLQQNYRQIDFENVNSLNGVDFESDYIFFFTGLTGTKAGFQKSEMFVKVNEIYLLNFLNAYVENNCKAKIIYPSSRLMYDSSPEPIAENGRKAFKSIYAVNKYAAEKYLEVYSNYYGIKYCVLRICVPYGSILDIEPSYGTFEAFTKQAKEKGEITVFGDGTSKRTFTDMADICAVLLKAAECEKCIGVFNMGGDVKTLGELATVIAEKNNAMVTYIPFPKDDEKLEVKCSVFDSSALDELIQYQYKMITVKE